MSFAVLALPFMTSAFGGGSANPSCRFKNLVGSQYNNGNACGTLADPYACIPVVAAQAAPTTSSGAALPGSYSDVGSYFGGGGCCQCGTHTGTIWNCSVNERFCFNGSCGYAAGSLGQSGVNSNNYLGIGIGGAAYAGGNAQLYHSCTGAWTWSGCMGNVPGGGGSSSGGCAGDCCFGGLGGAGLVIVSYDN
jgi:hypothetical protein